MTLNEQLLARKACSGCLPCMAWQPHHIYTTALWEQPSSSCRVCKTKVLLGHCPYDIRSKVVHENLSWLSYPLFRRVCSKTVLEMLVSCKNQKIVFPKDIVYSSYMNVRVAQVSIKKVTMNSALMLVQPTKYCRCHLKKLKTLLD